MINHQLIKASVQDVVETEKFRIIGVSSKENGNKWEKEWYERRIPRTWNMRKKGLQNEISDFPSLPVHWREMFIFNIVQQKKLTRPSTTHWMLSVCVSEIIISLSHIHMPFYWQFFLNFLPCHLLLRKITFIFYLTSYKCETTLHKNLFLGFFSNASVSLFSDYYFIATIFCCHLISWKNWILTKKKRERKEETWRRIPFLSTNVSI